jgi:hypothetical protein
MDVSNGVAFGNCTGVEDSVIATGAPHLFFLGYDVERRRLGTLGSESCAVPQHCV